jgi:5-methylcytosine-specific restriction endonuclease McrA
MYEDRLSRQAFYQSTEWRNLRAYKIFLNPFCERCAECKISKVAYHIHHKIDIEDDPNLALDINNLQSLCFSHHSSITFKNLAIKNKTKGIGHIKRLYNI